MSEIRTGSGQCGIDLPAMEAETERAESQESYHQISSGTCFRLGIVISVPNGDGMAYSIELLVRVSSDGNELRIPLLEKAVYLSRKLRSRDYSITCEDEGWILFQKPLFRKNVPGECSDLMQMISEFRSDREEPKIEAGRGDDL